MAFLDAFEDWKNVSATFTRTSNDIVNGRPTASTATTGPYKCINYQGAQAERIVAEKIRTAVSMVLITDTTADVRERDTTTIDGLNYVVINAEDVAMSGEALVIALEKKA